MPSGWVQVIRGPRPPSVQWPRAPRVAQAPAVVRPQNVPKRTVPNSSRGPPQKQGAERVRRSPEESGAAAQATVRRLEAALAALEDSNMAAKEVLQSSLQKARTAAKVLPDFGVRVIHRQRAESDEGGGSDPDSCIMEGADGNRVGGGSNATPPTPRGNRGRECTSSRPRCRALCIESQIGCCRGEEGFPSFHCVQAIRNCSHPNRYGQTDPHDAAVDSRRIGSVDGRPPMRSSGSSESWRLQQSVGVNVDAAVRMMEMSGRMVP